MTDHPADEPQKPDSEKGEQESTPTGGDYNVVLGPPPPGSIGSGNVYIRDADARGNVSHNSPESEAVGFAAHAGPGGKAFGAFASAGGESELVPLLQELVATLQGAGDEKGAETTAELIAEALSANPDANIIGRTWGVAKAAATLNGATALALKVEPLIHSLLNAL